MEDHGGLANTNLFVIVNVLLGDSGFVRIINSQKCKEETCLSQEYLLEDRKLNLAELSVFCFFLLSIYGTTLTKNLNHNKMYVQCIKGKKVRSYIARYPVRRTAQSALHFIPWQTCSFQDHLNFSGKHSAMLQLRKDYSFTFPPLSVLPGTHLYS